jgi:hypothetical protein
MTELLLVLHFIVILFVVFGFPVALWWKRPWFRYFHAAFFACITLLMVLGIPCPLTVVEEEMRGESYGGSFLATWLNRIIYMEWFEPRDILIIDICYLVLVFSSFVWYPVKKMKSGK